MLRLGNQVYKIKILRFQFLTVTPTVTELASVLIRLLPFPAMTAMLAPPLVLTEIVSQSNRNGKQAYCTTQFVKSPTPRLLTHVHV